MPAPTKEALERWGDPSLANLEDWLVLQGVDEVKAAGITHGVWIFHSFAMVPVFRSQNALSMAAGKSESGLKLNLYLPPGNPVGTVLERGKRWTQVTESFQREIQEVAAPQVDADLLQIPFRDRRDFNGFIKRGSNGLEIIGAYADNLRAQLAAVYGADQADAWLNRPYPLFNSRKPVEFLGSRSLGSAENSSIRRMIMRERLQLHET